jgi:hypothetical protein
MVRVLIRTALLSPDQLPMPVSITSAPSSSEPLTARHPGAVQAGLVLVVSGTAFVLASLLAPHLLLRAYDLLAHGPTVTTMDAAARLGAALFGSLTMGWGMMMHQLGAGVALTRAATIGAITWFVVDSICSVALGYAWNALSNVGFLLVTLLLVRRGGSA